jgi:hypothetical protein
MGFRQSFFGAYHGPCSAAAKAAIGAHRYASAVLLKMTPGAVTQVIARNNQRDASVINDSGLEAECHGMRRVNPHRINLPWSNAHESH